jgi:hypothetical protein
MFVGVIHRIHDPEGFRAAQVQAQAPSARWPQGVALPVNAASRDHRVGICLWEGESVNAVRDIVERTVGPFADNEYYEMEVDGLTPNAAPVDLQPRVDKRHNETIERRSHT